MVSKIKSRMNLCFVASKKLVPVNYIIDMHNVEDALNEEAVYNASIRCHCIAWNIKICLGHLNELDNGFAWMNCFTQGYHKMAEAGIHKYLMMRR